MTHTVDTKFWIGDTVYRVVDEDNSRGQVLMVEIGPGFTRYRAAFNDGESVYLEMELSESPCWVHVEDEQPED